MRSARSALGLSSAALSELLPADLRVSPQAIRAYEAGKNAPSVPMARQLEQLLLLQQAAMAIPVGRPLVPGELLGLYGFEDFVIAPPEAPQLDRIRELERENALLKDRLTALEARLDTAG